MPRADDHALPESLERPARALLEAIRRAERLLKEPEREPILAQLRLGLEAIHAAAQALQARPGGSPSPDALSGWSHGIREPLNSVLVWVQVLGHGIEDAKRVQGREAIEHCVRLLVQRLGKLPR